MHTACFHCGEPCPDTRFGKDGKSFCCQGCLVVHDLLTESGLGHFYDLNRHPGVRVRREALREQWAYLDAPALQQRLLDFTDGKVGRITFQIPAIHCVACVWLLENLFRLHPGVRGSQVNFPKREVAIRFATEQISLSGLVALLASIGYEPVLTLGQLEKPKSNPARQRQWLQFGIAGFAFGNIMLVSLPLYLGLDRFSGPLFTALFGYLSLALAAPVLFYSASDYWKSAWLSLRQRVLTLDVPIALGLAALYAQSAYEIVSGHGGGYLDSLSGLVFFLLCGRVFQQKTFDRMAFDRDYKCFFPLAVLRKTSAGEESVALSNLRVGDRVILRNGELIPADATLVGGPALIDYSFVTGESEPVTKAEGAYLYAGGQQIGGAIEAEIVKPVSQSYLTSLWNHETFQKDREDNLNTLTNRYSRRFTLIVIGLAVGAALCWFAAGDTARGLKAFTSVLIVACPCALALAAPFALGTAQRLLARIGVFLRNTRVIERMAKADALVFDKTGTLTASGANLVRFQAAEDRTNSVVSGQWPEDRGRDLATISGLSETEELWVYSLTRHSTHPHSLRIGEMFAAKHEAEPVDSFRETPGCGIEGCVAGHDLYMGSSQWLESRGVKVGQASRLSQTSESPSSEQENSPDTDPVSGSVVCLAIDGKFRGAFVLAQALRPETDQLIRRLGACYELALLSGDNAREREMFRRLFGNCARLHFHQSPLDKLDFIRGLQQSGNTVVMIGDGLNDAGALRQSDVGVAVVEKVGAFSPASDVILEAAQVPRLFEMLMLARQAVRIVQVSFGISAVYNVIGISIAAAGVLSPMICAVLMPLSSASVVLFACGATSWVARRVGVRK